MAEEFRIWRIDEESAHLLAKTPRMDTEQNLEDILARNPELLGDGVALVGRQIRTGGGPLDLLGVTSDGTLVVYELKRGGTPRDAITQALDYASALDEMSEAELSQHIAAHSDSKDIPKIDDFADWYADHSSNGEISRRGRTAICCVGIGADDATRRIAKWLREAGVDISIVEFAAYQRDGEQLLARYVELDDERKHDMGAVVRTAVDPRNRAREREALAQFDAAVKVMRGCFNDVEHREYPHKNLLRFSLPATDNDGQRLTQRNVSAVCVRGSTRVTGQIYIVIYDPISKSFPEEFDQMQSAFGDAGVPERKTSHKSWRAFRAASVAQVETVRPALQKFLGAVIERYGGG